MLLEKYWNDEYGREYYYNPETQESIWELPKGVKVEINDYTEGAAETVDEKTHEKKDDRQEENEDEVDQRILDYKAQTSQFELA